MLRSMLALFVSTVLLTPPPAPKPVGPNHRRGTALCLENRDGTVVLIEPPHPAWKWQTFDDRDLWFVEGVWRPGTRGETLNVKRVDRVPSRAEFAKELHSETRTFLPKGFVARLDVWQPSEVPTPGSVRYEVTFVRYPGRPREEIVELDRRGGGWLGYYTPHGLHFSTLLAAAVPGTPFAALLQSYRMVAGRCGEGN
jgi:hypothetical protein